MAADQVTYINDFSPYVEGMDANLSFAAQLSRRPAAPLCS
jgi:hypothetical protein